MRSFRSSVGPTFISLALLAGCSSGDGSTPDPVEQPTPTGVARKFEVTIENVSGESALTTPISPGAFATHGADFSLFAEGQPDRGEGLARIAEEGNPSTLLAMLDAKAKNALLSKGVFEIPAGKDARGPATPGGKYVFTVEASAAAPNLSFATMYGQSNDWFLAPKPAGVPLFDASGAALPERDITDMIYVWDVGSELNEAPGMGPDQGPRQKGSDTGAAEGVLAPFTDSTRAYPAANRVARVSVTRGTDGSFAITVTNTSGAGSSITTGISPVFYAVHDKTWSLFEEGKPASRGLEGIAEDGDAPGLAEEHRGAGGILTTGAATVANGAAKAGGAPPGGSFTFQVKPDTAHRFLSIATMLGESNDAFLGFGKSGVALLEESGMPRDVEAIADEFARRLIVWDAGTELNEVPGAGGNQGPRQGKPNTGSVDPTPGVHRYADPTNDLATRAGGVIDVRVTDGPDAAHLTVTVTNTSGATPFPGRASPIVWAVHTGSHTFFRPGAASPASVENLAEDGNPLAWEASFAGLEDVAGHGVVNMPEGTSSAGPIVPGMQYKFVIPVGGNAKFFDFAQMWTPSNDTFLSLGPKGVALVDATGKPRTAAAITADVRDLLSAWDAGTEANQSGALGPDQAPRQAAQNTGSGEGSGVVRLVDATWGVPSTSHLVRVRVRPL